MNIKKILKTTAIITPIVLSSLIGKAVYEEYYSDRADRIQDFINIIKQEQLKLAKSKDRRIIYCGYGPTPWGSAASMKIAEGKYRLILDGKRNRAVIRHELYHIYAGHCDTRFNKEEWSIRDKIHDELTANLYAYYGLKL
jgi:hypothetical protein